MEQEQSLQETQSHKAPSEQTQKSGAQAARRTYRCVNCDIEFFWLPTVVQGKVYCCTGCAAGGPCNCDYSLYRSVVIMGVIYYEQEQAEGVFREQG